MNARTIALAALLFPHIMFAQKEIPLYNGSVPNAKTPTVPPDTTTTKLDFGNTTIDIVHGVIHPTLTVYLADKAKATGAGVIICPGGGYHDLAIGHEGHDMARRLAAEGIAAFVLKYRLPLASTMIDKTIGPLQDAQRAIQLVRENAAKWNVNPQKIGILGSSAGGHLAASAGTHWQDAKIANPGRTSLRPDFMILNYPVISFSDSLAHNGSRIALVGPNPVPEEISPSYKVLGIPEGVIRYFSNETQVNAQTPGTFITTTLSDQAVSPGNTFVFMAALQQQHVPVELFLYTKGDHGYGMHNPQATVQWFDACIGWIKKEGWRKAGQ